MSHYMQGASDRQVTKKKVNPWKLAEDRQFEIEQLQRELDEVREVRDTLQRQNYRSMAAISECRKRNNEVENKLAKKEGDLDFLRHLLQADREYYANKLDKAYDELEDKYAELERLNDILAAQNDEYAKFMAERDAELAHMHEVLVARSEQHIDVTERRQVAADLDQTSNAAMLAMQDDFNMAAELLNSFGSRCAQLVYSLSAGVPSTRRAAGKENADVAQRDENTREHAEEARGRVDAMVNLAHDIDSGTGNVGEQASKELKGITDAELDEVYAELADVDQYVSVQGNVSPVLEDHAVMGIKQITTRGGHSATRAAVASEARAITPQYTNSLVYQNTQSSEHFASASTSTASDEIILSGQVYRPPSSVDEPSNDTHAASNAPGLELGVRVPVAMPPSQLDEASGRLIKTTRKRPLSDDSASAASEIDGEMGERLVKRLRNSKARATGNNGHQGYI